MPSKSKSKKPKKASPKKSKPAIPAGFRTVTPYLFITGTGEALEWYKKAFNAKEDKKSRQATPDGRIIHARIKIGDSIIMMSDGMEGGSVQSPKSLGATTSTMHIYTKNVDKLFQQAVEAGAKVTMPLDNQFWGERYGQVVDPFGHSWSMSMQVAMSKEEMKEKQEKAMSMFSRPESSAGKEQAEQTMTS